MITYPFPVPSGTNIIPYVSGTNNIGSAAAPFQTIFSNNYSGNSASITSVTVTTISGNNVNASNINATNISGTNITFTGVLTYPSGSIVAGLQNLYTVDFGTKPVQSATFTVSNSAVNVANYVSVMPCAIAPSGRTPDDWAWDSINFSSAVLSSGNITIYAKVENPCSVVGTRNVIYMIN